jgi:hypothetical protein
MYEGESQGPEHQHEHDIDAGGPPSMPADYLRAAGFTLPPRITRVLLFHSRHQHVRPNSMPDRSPGQRGVQQQSPLVQQGCQNADIHGSLLDELIDDLNVEAHFSELYEEASEAVIDAEQRLPSCQP